MIKGKYRNDEELILDNLESHFWLPSEPPKPATRLARWLSSGTECFCVICRRIDLCVFLPHVPDYGIYGECDGIRGFYDSRVHPRCVRAALAYPEAWGHRRVDIAINVLRSIAEWERRWKESEDRTG